MTAVRITLSIVAALLGVLFLAIALTAPMIAATAPAVLGLAALVVAFLFWPRHRNRKAQA
jgi:hypothetical protein